MSENEPTATGLTAGGDESGAGAGAPRGRPAGVARHLGRARQGTIDDAGPRQPDPRMIPRWQSTPPQRPARDAAGPHPRHADTAGAGDDLVIRPFLLTGGRTRPVQDGLRVEALVQAQPPALAAPLRFEARRIVEVCQRPTSVAELAANLRLPLGVTRVLVADLVADGSLDLVKQEELSIELIERIRDRVRAL